MQKKIIRYLIFLVSFLIVLGVFVIAYWLTKDNREIILPGSPSQSQIPSKEVGLPSVDSESKCPIEYEIKTVSGTSLSGIVEPGAKVELARGYYKCRLVLREDIVAYDFAGNPNPIIKIVKAIPGDSFHLEKDAKSGGWLIYVNGAALRNSEGKEYLLNDQTRKMLSLYEADYRGLIPLDAYLILGNRPEGTTDSTRFGLIGKGDVIGKILIPGDPEYGIKSE